MTPNDPSLAAPDAPIPFCSPWGDPETMHELLEWMDGKLDIAKAQLAAVTAERYEAKARPEPVGPWGTLAVTSDLCTAFSDARDALEAQRADEEKAHAEETAELKAEIRRLKDEVDDLERQPVRHRGFSRFDGPVARLAGGRDSVFESVARQAAEAAAIGQKAWESSGVLAAMRESAKMADVLRGEAKMLDAMRGGLGRDWVGEASRGLLR